MPRIDRPPIATEQRRASLVMETPLPIDRLTRWALTHKHDAAIWMPPAAASRQRQPPCKARTMIVRVHRAQRDIRPRTKCWPCRVVLAPKPPIKVVPEVVLEVVPEVRPEVGPEVGPEVVPEVGPEVVPEVGPEVGPEERPHQRTYRRSVTPPEDWRLLAKSDIHRRQRCFGGRTIGWRT